MDLKNRIKNIKNWQHQSCEFHFASDEEHECLCCGHRYKGNFCPCCSQKAGVGDISWNSVRKGVMEIWGLSNRSLIYSLWQLIVRPGHFISEYLRGKFQVSFPPVKMLFLVAILYTLIYYWLFQHVLNLHVETTSAVNLWDAKNAGWSRIILSLSFLFPTWVLFQNSPKFPHLSIPKAFFIAVFMSILEIMIELFVYSLGLLCGASEDVIALLGLVLFAVYYFVAYKQIFGFGVWGTLWRHFIMMMCSLFLWVLFDEFVEYAVDPDHPFRIQSIFSWSSIVVLLLLLGYLLTTLTRKWPDLRAWWLKRRK